MSAESDESGTPTPIPVVTVVELYGQVARYRTSLVTLMELVKRNLSGYMSWHDQNLINQIERMLEKDR